MELTNWKTLHKYESWGHHTFGVEIRVAMDRGVTENDNMAMHRIADEVKDVIMRETLRLDPETQKGRAEERERLLACFNHAHIFAEEIPNGYDSSWVCSQSPWFRVTTHKGIITLGWRRRVIEIKWDDVVNDKAEDLFPNENVTKYERLIHAYGYEKAQAYISRLLRS